MKKCTSCHVEKPYELFNKHCKKKDGYSSNCKECIRLSRIRNIEKTREYNKTEGRKKMFKRQREKNRSKYCEYQKKYNLSLDIEVRRKRDREYVRNRKERDFIYRLAQNLGVQLQQAYRSGGFKKPEKRKNMENILGCSWEYFVGHMRSQYTEGMTDNNNTKKGWHIEHIIPKSLAYGCGVDKLYELFHYSNLRPMWAEENLKKGNKIL